MTAINQNTLPVADVVSAKHIIDTKTGTAETYYHAAVLLDNSAIEDNANERCIEQGIQLSLETGLSPVKQRELFIDAIYRYARILLKYKKWHDAFNFLKLAAQLGDQSPGWVSNHLAKLHYEINPEEAFNAPLHVLSKLKQGALDPNYRGQALNIFRDFLIRAQQNFDGISDLEHKQNQYNQFRKEISQFLETIEDSSTGFLPQSYKQLFSQEAEYEEAIAINESTELSVEKDRKYLETIESLRMQLAEEEQLVAELTNENERLHQYMATLEKEIHSLARPKQTQKLSDSKICRLKLLILGGSHLKTKDMLGILKNFGLNRNNITIANYEKTKRFDIDKLRYNSPYSGILIGPVAHKVIGTGDYSSLLQKLKNEEGFPATIEIRTVSGGLKITKTAFKTALSHLLIRIRSIDPELAQVSV